MRLRTLATVFITLSIGLLVGGVFVGRATAQAPAPGQPAYGPPPGSRYQYACYTKMEQRIWDQGVQQRLNQLGAEGWRLMENRQIMPNGFSDVYCFERRY
jgi:hypothetical protein